MPDANTTVPATPKAKKKQPWYKRWWLAIAGVLVAVVIALIVWRIKQGLIAEQKELARLRTKAEQDKVNAMVLKHRAKIEDNDEKMAVLNAEANVLKATASKEITRINNREKEINAQLAQLDSITSWEELDAINNAR